MSFMQKQVIEADYYELETTQGTFVIPCDAVMGKTPAGAATPALLAVYCDGEPLDPMQDDIEPQHGFLARLSAPGYMDCTEWSAFKTKEEAEAYFGWQED